MQFPIISLLIIFKLEKKNNNQSNTAAFLILINKAFLTEVMSIYICIFISCLLYVTCLIYWRSVYVFIFSFDWNFVLNLSTMFFLLCHMFLRWGLRFNQQVLLPEQMSEVKKCFRARAGWMNQLWKYVILEGRNIYCNDMRK